ncbi:hypothetical protein MNBD_GAMMA03-280 [hydrothermal vent metagenome]|uniref:Zinc finger DksA/TraR C4-type domain-containing protein n=1 Tax=hydrothermal vent metagenome TaxID=652676 RepID=A0A3B0X1A9_9ZZZZ
MPTKKKMDKKKLDQYKQVLLKLKWEFSHDINNMSKNTGSSVNDSSDISGHVQHMADVATDMYDREFTLGLASNEREVLHKIDGALKRIDDGEGYGVCVECEKSVPVARLKAIPYVETCLQCQEKIEAEG